MGNHKEIYQAYKWNINMEFSSVFGRYIRGVR